jgi:hypothetical protein
LKMYQCSAFTILIHIVVDGHISIFGAQWKMEQHQNLLLLNG